MPEALGRYTLVRVHATGGCGRVWLAKDNDLEREVALKEIHSDARADPVVRARFLREARITGQLQHPSIPPVYESARRAADGEPFYTMRFVEGRTLRDVAGEYHRNRAAGRAGAGGMVSLLPPFLSVCNAVAYAHSRRVIHRDLKGENIVLGKFGEVFVLDWGLAKIMGQADDAFAAVHPAVSPGGDALTVQGQILGTPAYMAPEQADGRHDEIGPATDIYGLGAILYEVLTGQPPFSGADAAAVLWKVRNEEPLPPRQVNGQVAPALEAICLKALSKRPADRYASAALLTSEVLAFMTSPPPGGGEQSLERLIRLYHEKRTSGLARQSDLAGVVSVLASGSQIVAGHHSRGALSPQLTAHNFEAMQGGQFVSFHATPGPERVTGFLAPEQADGKSGRVDRRTDVYRLGAILYDVLVGQPPFTGEDPDELRRRVRTEQPRRPSEIWPRVPRALEAVCLKALAKDPENRYPSADEFARDLGQWVRGQPVSVFREAWPVRIGQWVMRPQTHTLAGCLHQFAVITILICSCAAVFAGFIGILSARIGLMPAVAIFFATVLLLGAGALARRDPRL
jgi:serine/threonine protein kinase